MYFRIRDVFVEWKKRSALENRLNEGMQGMDGHGSRLMNVQV